jgi:phage gpG-like protein
VIVFDVERMIASANAVSNRLSAAGQRAANVGPALEAAALELRELIDQSFATETSPSGAKWKPLAASTIKRRNGRGRGTLDLTGRLRNSFRYTVRGNSLRLYNTSGYFDPHQRGDRKRTPPRPPQRAMVPFHALGGGTYRLMSTGPAARWAQRMRAHIKRYIIRGRV